MCSPIFQLALEGLIMFVEKNDGLCPMNSTTSIGWNLGEPQSVFFCI